MEMNERQQQIFDLVQQHGRISVNKLAANLYVSLMTIRRDLTEMELNGLVKRYRGGAVSQIGEHELPVAQRIYLGEEEKRQLAGKAEKYLHDQLTVFIDSSSTCAYIIPYLKKYKDVKLITNSVKSLLHAAEYHIPAALIGGDYNVQDMCLVGPLAANEAASFNVDAAFFSAQSLSDEGIISDSNLPQIEIRKIIMKNASHTVFLFETHKLHKKSLYTLCHADGVTEILLPDTNIKK